jgi:beta-phosphoglucomutase-like phosphatase (HAD superfamily)
MPTILLFDVDGTLVSSGGVGRLAIEKTFERRHGRRDVVSFSFAGMTDKAIVRNGLLALAKGFASEPELLAEMDATLAFYLRVLEEEAAAHDGIRVHDGILRVLDLAEACPNLALGLGTGNLREGARIKLGHAGIYHRFSFGGFGDDSIDRPEILAAGARRGAAELGLPLTRPKTLPLPRPSAPSASRWPRACTRSPSWRPTRPPSRAKPWPTNAPTLSCSGNLS